MKIKYVNIEIKGHMNHQKIQKWKNVVAKKLETELNYLKEKMFNNYLYIRMHKSGETPSVLWMHESIPKETQN